MTIAADIMAAVALRLFRFQSDFALFWVSCWLLFLEVLMIRWLSAEIRIFSYFHNLVLLFCFLGIGLGCSASTRRISPLATFLSITFLTLAIKFDRYLGNFSPRNISRFLSLDRSFHIWWAEKSGASWYHDLISISFGTLLLFVTMALLTLVFIPLGQRMGKLLNEHPNALRAYAWNLAGSLAGIWLFYVISLYSLPPVVWFLVAGFACLPLLGSQKRKLLAAIVLLPVIWLSLREQSTPEHFTVWSPYQKLGVTRLDVQIKQERVPYGYLIHVNSVGYMRITNYSESFQKRYPSLFPPDQIPYDHYNIPYRFAQHPDNVLIVGAGAGNDAAAAIRNGARRITAVEIDPEIIAIGRRLHPEHPYSHPRVLVVNEDARTFFARSKEKFDLIVFGLLDAHTLSSSFSNVRLDNYVYTKESLLQAKKLLKTDGILLMMFEVADDVVGARLSHNLASAFGMPPLGFTVRSGFRGWGGNCFVEGDPERIKSVVLQDARLQSLLAAEKPKFDRWATMPVAPTTDDWPYLYLQNRAIPKLYFLIFLLLALLSHFGIRKWTAGSYRFHSRFFFLGAGFLLLEVQNISKSALLFGSTWVVNTLVISSVLVLIMLANYFCSIRRVRATTPYYVALLLSLLAIYVVPIHLFQNMNGFARLFVPVLFMSVPVFFAGIIFSTTFLEADDRASAFASNLFGAMVGGISECLSFLLGIKALLLVCAGFYLLSMRDSRPNR